MAIARATRRRIGSSSSTISTRDIVPTCESDSGVAAGKISLVEEAHVDIAAFRRRRGETRLELGSLARSQNGLLQHGIPGVDFGALCIAHAEAQPGNLQRLVGFAGDRAFDDEYRLAFDHFGRDPDVLEAEPTQIDVETHQFVEG